MTDANRCWEQVFCGLEVLASGAVDVVDHGRFKLCHRAAAELPPTTELWGLSPRLANVTLFRAAATAGQGAVLAASFARVARELQWKGVNVSALPPPSRPASLLPELVTNRAHRSTGSTAP